MRNDLGLSIDCPRWFGRTYSDRAMRITAQVKNSAPIMISRKWGASESTRDSSAWVGEECENRACLSAGFRKN